MRPGSGSGQRSLWGYFNVVAKVFAVLLVFHLLAVIILSAQSTAAGGPLILFPLASVWRSYESAYQDDGSQVGRVQTLEEELGAALSSGAGSDDPAQRAEEAEPEFTEAERKAYEKVTGKPMKKGKKKKKGDYDNEDMLLNILPNPIRLPILPQTDPTTPASPPPPPMTEEAREAAKEAKKEAANEDQTEAEKQEQQHKADSEAKVKLLDQLRERRKEVERLMAKRRAEREGISVEEAEKQSEGRSKEAVETAVLAVEKPQDNVKQAFSGGQNGRLIPAPKILYNLFRKDDRPREDKSWLDRITDALIDKLELRWEDDEEARMQEDEDSEPLLSEDLQLDNSATEQRPVHRQWPADECANLLKVPKVAMLYLTKGDLYHQSTWKLWFEYAGRFLPIDPVKASSCGNDPKAWQAAQRACRRREKGNGEDTLANQHLFNVYIHVGMNNQEFKGFPPDSIWYNRDIVDRVQVEWGRHSLVTATRNLMKVALQEPLNRKLILLSEAGIPLYPPTALYYQLITEDKSRINSCTLPGWERHPHRWTDRMETPQMKHHHWRKSSQWFGLQREHAELVMADTVINNAFHDHCYPTTEEGWWRDCFSDEHYFSTLLSVLGRENETDCKGFMMHVDWSRGGAHPRTYEQREISAARLRLLRMPTENCGYPSAIKTAAAQFITREELNNDVCSKEVVDYSKTLGPQCPLFARKFAPETAGAITALIAECKNRLKIVHGNECQRRLAMMKKYM